MGHLWEQGSGPSIIPHHRDSVRCLSRQGPVRAKSATRHLHRVARVPTPCPSSPLPRGAGSVCADHGPQIRARVPRRNLQPWLESGTLPPAPPCTRGHCATPVSQSLREAVRWEVSCWPPHFLPAPALHPGAAWLLGLTGREQRRGVSHGTAPSPPAATPASSLLRRGGETL